MRCMHRPVVFIQKTSQGKRALKGGHLGFVVSSNKRISYSSEVFWLPLSIPLGCWEWDVAVFEAACPSHLFQQKEVLRNEGRIKNQSHWDVTNEFYTTSHKSCKHTHSKVAISSYKQKYIFVPKILNESFECTWGMRLSLVFAMVNQYSFAICSPRFEIYVILKWYQTSTRRRCILCHDAQRHLKRRACKYTQSIGIFK